MEGGKDPNLKGIYNHHTEQNTTLIYLWKKMNFCKWVKSLFRFKKEKEEIPTIISNDEKVIRGSFWSITNNSGFSETIETIKYHPNPWWWVESKKIIRKNYFEHKMMRPQFGSSPLIDIENWKIISGGWNNWYEENNLINNKFFGGHAWQGFIRKYKQTFEQEPELLALVNGKRVSIGETSKLCVSNQKVVDLYYEYVKSIMKTTPTRNLVSMEPSDGGNFCQCPNCTKIGGISDQIYYLINRVAKLIKVDYPNVKINLYAYYLHSEPPKEKIEDNIVVGVIPAGFQTIYSPEYMLTLWRDKFDGDLYWRDYFGIPQWTGDFPRINVGTFLLRTYLTKKLNYKSLIMECGHNINAAILSVLFSQIWDSDLSFGDVYQKFLNDCFPETKYHIENLFDKWFQNWYGLDTLKYSLYDLTESLKIVKNTNERKRIIDLIGYVLMIQKRYDWLTDTKNKDLSVEYFDWCYKLGYRNLVNPGALWDSFNSGLPTELINELTPKYSRTNKIKDWVTKLEDSEIENELNEWLSKNNPVKLILNKKDVFESHMIPFSDKDLSVIHAVTIQSRNKIEVVTKGKLIIENLEQKDESLLYIHNKDFSVSKPIFLKTNKTTEIELPEKYDTYRIWSHRKNTKLVLKGRFFVVTNQDV